MRTTWLAVILLGEALLAGAAPASDQQQRQQSTAGSRERSDTRDRHRQKRSRHREAEQAPEEIVVLGRRPAPGVGLVRIDQEEIERRGNQTTAGLLEDEPAINLTRNSRGERLFSLRGFNQRQVLVLIDGVPAVQPYDGLLNLDMLPAWSLERVTIVKSPGSTCYGPNGLGGAVNIVTRRPGRGPLLGGRLAAGRGGVLQLQARHALQAGPLGYTVYGGLLGRDALALSGDFAPTANEDGGWRQNSDRRLYQAGLGVDWEVQPRQHLRGGVLYLDGAFGVPPSTRDERPRFWRFTDWRTIKVWLGHHGRAGTLETDEVVYGLLLDNLLDSYDDATYSSQEGRRAFHSRYHDGSAGGRLRLQHTWEVGAAGMARLGLWLGAQHDRHAEDDGSGATLPVRTRTLLTAAPRLELFPLPQWSLGGGLQLDYEFPGGNNQSQALVGPFVFLGWRPGPRLYLQASISRHGRFPSLRERFSAALGRQVPNPALAAERAWHFDLDIRWQPWRQLQLRAGLFAAEVDNLIEAAVLGSGLEQLQNLGQARLRGLDLEVQARLRRWLAVRLGYARLDARALDRPGQERLEYRPDHKLLLAARIAPCSWAEARLRVLYVGEQWYQDRFSRQWGRLPGRVTVAARLRLRLFSGVTTWIEGRNLFDADYQSEYGYPEAGWYLGAGLEATWEQKRRGQAQPNGR